MKINFVKKIRKLNYIHTIFINRIFYDKNANLFYLLDEKVMIIYNIILIEYII